MLSRTNIQDKLKRVRDKRITPNDLLTEAKEILLQNEKEREDIENRLSNTGSSNGMLDLDLLEASQIFHIEDIKKICVDYRLRFLDSSYFKGEFPAEAISKIRQMEKDHNTTLSGFKIIAPAKRLKLENADDPLLFAPLGNGYYYLIHKWGNDLHPLRKLLMWPYKSFENLVFTVFLISVLLTAITPVHLFSEFNRTQEYVLLFLFIFKAVGGIVLYYGFAKGKNFNTAIWDSKYYNA